MTMLGIFAKPPRPGLVKTRLIPDIGADNAARVYRYCLEYTLRMARDSGIDYQLYLTETCCHPAGRQPRNTHAECCKGTSCS
jgi:glycosyltransferase A (GT-A) superfamily protein (DUF2064 family)